MKLPIRIKSVHLSKFQGTQQLGCFQSAQVSLSKLQKGREGGIAAHITLNPKPPHA